jgi:hypothetical protein
MCNVQHALCDAPQAISYLRQKQLGEVATSLNNLLACEKAQPSERPVTWDPKAELQDLYSSYLTRVRSRRCDSPMVCSCQIP